MAQHIRSIAVMFAIGTFFLMSLIGWVNNVSPATCCSRSVGGAIIVYLTVKIAARAIIAVIINAIAESKANKLLKKDNH